MNIFAPTRELVEGNNEDHISDLNVIFKYKEQRNALSRMIGINTSP